MDDYQIMVDVTKSGDWDDIKVKDFIVSADSPKDAYTKGTEKAEKFLLDGYKDFYVWEITEEDIVTNNIN